MAQSAPFARSLGSFVKSGPFWAQFEVLGDVLVENRQQIRPKTGSAPRKQSCAKKAEGWRAGKDLRHRLGGDGEPTTKAGAGGQERAGENGRAERARVPRRPERGVGRNGASAGTGPGRPERGVGRKGVGRNGAGSAGTGSRPEGSRPERGRVGRKGVGRNGAGSAGRESAGTGPGRPERDGVGPDRRFRPSPTNRCYIPATRGAPQPGQSGMLREW